MCTTSNQPQSESVVHLINLIVGEIKGFYILVGYFPQENEAAIEFAARVKADICKKGGLVDLPW